MASVDMTITYPGTRSRKRRNEILHPLLLGPFLVGQDVRAGLAARTATGEGEPGDVRTLTYKDLKQEVSRIANALKELGVRKGDRVCIYMPMVPELAMAMLACARVGAAHSVVFGGFSAESLYDRINDAEAKVVITADGGWRRGNIIPLKKTVALYE